MMEKCQLWDEQQEETEATSFLLLKKGAWMTSQDNVSNLRPTTLQSFKNYQH